MAKVLITSLGGGRTEITTNDIQNKANSLISSIKLLGEEKTGNIINEIQDKVRDLILLISSGKIEVKEGTITKKYSETTYKLDNKDIVKTPFIAEAIEKEWNIDKTIIMGTTGSMWSVVYKKYCEKYKKEIDKNYMEYLKELEINAKQDSNLAEVQIEKFNETFEGKVKGIVLKWGLTEEEILENFDLIFEIEKDFEDKDEVYLDITHSFRSMAFWIFLVMTYLTDITKKREIKIKEITYGMFEASVEKGKTPIILLKTFVDILEWFKAASELKNYGNSYSIVRECRLKLESQSLEKELENFSNAMNMNYVDSILESLNKLKELENEGEFNFITGPARHIVPDILKTFIKTFDIQETDQKKRKYMLRAILTKWHFDQKRYSMAAININEALVDFIMNILEFPLLKNGVKTDESKLAKIWLERVEGKLKTKSPFLYEYGEMYVVTNRIRNKIAHSLENDTIKEDRDLENDIAFLQKYSDQILDLLSLKNEDLIKEEDRKLGISDIIKKENKEEFDIEFEMEKPNLLRLSIKGPTDKEQKAIKRILPLNQLVKLRSNERKKWKESLEENDLDKAKELIDNSCVNKIDYIIIKYDGISNSIEDGYKEELEKYIREKGIKILKERKK